MSKKTLIFIVAISIAIVMTVGICVGVGVLNATMNTPQNVVKIAISNAFRDLGERDEIKPLISTITSGSVEIDYSQHYYYDVEFGGKLYFSETSALLEGAHFTNNAFSIEGSAYISPEMIYIEESKILDGVVGIVKGDDNAAAFEDSIFAYGSGAFCAAPYGYVHNSIVGLLEMYDGTDYESLDKNVSETFKAYYHKLFELLEAEAEYKAQEKKTRVGGSRIDARVITVTLDMNSIQYVAEELLQAAEDDEQLRSLVLESLYYFEDFLVSGGIISPGDDIEDLYDDSIDGAIEGLEKQLNYFDDAGLTLEIVTPKDSAMLQKLTVTFSTERNNVESEYSLCLDAGANGLKNTDIITLTVADSRSDETNTFEYKVTENSSKKYEAVLTYENTTRGYKRKWTPIQVEINKERERIELCFNESRLALKGSFSEDSGSLVFDFNKIYVDDRLCTDVSLAITINTSDTMPQPLSADDISNFFYINESELKKILNQIRG